MGKPHRFLQTGVIVNEQVNIRQHTKNLEKMCVKLLRRRQKFYAPWPFVLVSFALVSILAVGAYAWFGEGTGAEGKGVVAIMALILAAFVVMMAPTRKRELIADQERKIKSYLGSISPYEKELMKNVWPRKGGGYFIILSRNGEVISVP